MDREAIIQDLIKIDFQSEYEGQGLRGQRDFTITLTTAKGTQTFPFFQGSAHTEDPTLVDVLYCLISDARVSDFKDVNEFIDEFGYDDLTKGREVYRACLRQTKNLERLGILEFLHELEVVFRDF